MEFTSARVGPCSAGPKDGPLIAVPKGTRTGQRGTRKLAAAGTLRSSRKCHTPRDGSP